METTQYKEKYDKIQALKNEFEAGRITQEEMAPDDVVLLHLVYKLELLDIEAKSELEKYKLEDYKERMRNAIDFLKNKKNT